MLNKMKPTIKVFYIENEIAVDDFAAEIWQRAEITTIQKLWSGETVQQGRHAAARLLWTNKSLFVRFDCEQNEQLIVSENPNTQIEAEKLWERDVCELFLAPDVDAPERYFEFEVAPTGEWLDFAVHQLADRRETDTTFDAGLKTAALISENSFTVIFQVKWSELGKKPESGDKWRGNLFRCIGTNEETRYMSWQPTLTEIPNFHVPEKFGWIEFCDSVNVGISRHTVIKPTKTKQ